MNSFRSAALGLVVACVALAPPIGFARAQTARTEKNPWRLPLEGDCRGVDADDTAREDLSPASFAPNDVLGHDDIDSLEPFLPPAVWAQRDQFFFRGMRIEIGDCFRDYSPPAFYQQATQRFAGEAQLLDNGGIEDYTAGLPFAPETISGDDPRLGQRWAWNFAHRYRAAGHRGQFRISELRSGHRVGHAFEGDSFVVRTAHRAERKTDGYQLSGAGDHEWVAGGRFVRPAAARNYAWRQYRSVDQQGDPLRSDDLHAYVPAHRRVRRLNSNWVEGLHVPTIGITTGKASGGGFSASVDESSESAAIAMTTRGGFEALEIRPLLHRYSVIGLRDVLTPINVRGSMHPENPDRNFGPSGLSFADDRWDLRRALVLESTPRDHSRQASAGRSVYYLDLQTLQPLYEMVYNAQGELVDVGIFAGRWSEDRNDYPTWPDRPERAVRVIDPVASVFANLANRSSWRRESWGLVSVPPEDWELDRVLSVGSLTERK